MTDEAKVFEKKLCNPNLGPTGLNQVQNEVFRHFPEFESLVFLEIAYSDTLQQCLTSSGGKTHEKSFWTQIWVKRAKIGSEIRGFFAISSCLVH